MNHFARTYRDARQLFLQAAAARNAVIESHVHPVERGIDGEELAIDVALLGPPQAEHVVLLHSGTHGIEGYCGSGIQHALLDEASLLDRAGRVGARLVLLHALNPYGFSHYRRTNEDNVDLNRNFVDFSQAPEPDPEYETAHALLFPPTWPWSGENQAAIAEHIARHGIAHWQAAITHGQRVRPDGLFYAGRHPAWSNQVLRDVLRRHVGGRRSLYWIDVHTGLGPSGVGELIYGGRDVAGDVARTRACWGPKVTSIYDGSSTSARLDGIVGNAAYESCPGVAFAGIALEFGTLPLPDVLEALRFDQWVRNRAPDDPALLEQARRRMFATFFIDSDEWRQAVIAQGVAATERALDAIERERR